jgi:hypothetical protein
MTQPFAFRCRVQALVALWLCAIVAAAPTAYAGKLELRQAGDVGAGTGFRRGDSCLVLTAAHVVREAGVDVKVLDRTGATANAQVAMVNLGTDVALVQLTGKTTIECTERWPDSDWLTAEKWSPRSEVNVIRHYPSGRETVVALRWAGGTTETLTFRPADKMEIRASDSGSLVSLGDRMVGIVKAVSTDTDRVEVVRFDVIERLFGSRFRSTGAAPIAFEGVHSRGRLNPSWTSYASAWLTESAGRHVVTLADQQARCKVRAEVLDWARRNVTNPAYGAARSQLAGCKTDLLWRNSKSLIKMCEQSARDKLSSIPRSLQVHALQMKLDMTSKSGAVASKLRTVEHQVDTQDATSRADTELEVLQHAFGQIAQEMFGTGVCD